MSKKIPNVIRILLLLSLSTPAISQTETFDIVTYTAPRDWKKETNVGVVNFTNANTSTGSFCVIAIYASTASTGNPQKDFKRDWKELVATPFNAEANPKSETQITPEGWTVVTASAPVKQDGVDLYIMLTVASGYGKSLSIRTSLNDQAYIAQIDELFNTMELDKSASISTNNNNTNTVSNPTISAAGKFGALAYEAPTGWNEQKFSDGVVFKPVDLPSGEHMVIHIMQPLNAVGTLEQALAQSFDDATTMYNATNMYQAGGKYGKNAPQKSFRGWEYIRGKGAVKDASGAELALELFVIKINSRFERIAIYESRKYCGGVSRYFASDKIRYRNSIEDFLYSIQFSDFNERALKDGSAKGNGIVGVWQGTIQGTGAATGVKLEVFTPVFFNNGQVYFGPKFPTEGLEGLKSRIPPELYPRNWGTYTWTNGAGMLNMPFASIPFRTAGDKLIVTKNQTDWTFFKLNSVDGARFNGTYTMSKSYDIYPTITFTSDGQFHDQGVVRILGHDNNSCTNEGFNPGSGTYEVKNYSILFNYNDGRKVKFAFLGADYDKGNPAPPMLRMSYNEDPLTRQ